MKLCFKPVLSFLLFFYAATVFSQTNMSGKITAASGEPLPNVQVMVRDAGNEKIYAFTTSTKDGSYSLNYTGEKSSKKLVFRLLGYDEETVDLSSVSFPYNVILIQTENVLNEIVIKPQAIRIKNDTTEYLVSSFSDGTEWAIEDVLKKMPGINVEENGNIFFKGKAIEKILLDDVDLFDKNYTIASKNVPANYINKVQAIENFHDNRLLKDAEYSDKVALNLSLKDDLKMQRPVGQAYAAGGYENRYSISARPLTMNKKLKIFDVFDVNNTGSSSSFSQGNYFNNLYENLNSYADAEVVYTPFMSYAEGNIRRAESCQFNNSLHFVYQPVKKMQITGNLLIDRTCKSYTDNTKTLYFSDSLLIDRTSNVTEKPQTIYGLACMKYDIKENISLIYTGKYNNHNKSTTNELFIPEARLSNISRNDRFFSNDLDLTVALQDSSAFAFKTMIISNKNSQHFDYSVIENPFSEIDQIAQATTFQHNTYLKYFNKSRKRFFYTLQASLNRNNQDISILGIYQNEPENSAGSLDDLSFLLHADLIYKTEISTISFKSGIGYRKQVLNSSLVVGTDDKRIEFSPDLSYLINLKNHKISISGGYTQGKFSLLDYMDYFTDYRDRKKGANVYTYGSTVNYSVSYIYSGPLLQPFFILSYVNTISKNVYARQTNVGPLMNYSSLIPGSDSKSHFVLTNYKTYNDAIRHGFDFNSSLYFSEYFNAVNSEELRKNKMLSSSSSFSVKSVYDIPFNYVLGVRFRYSSFETDILKNHSVNYSFFQDFLYKPNKRLKVKVSVDEYFLGKDHKMYLFIRPDISYSLPKRRITIGVNAYNILNNSNITEFNLNDFYSVETNYSIVPAQYMASIQFQF